MLTLERGRGEGGGRWRGPTAGPPTTIEQIRDLKFNRGRNHQHCWKSHGKINKKISGWLAVEFLMVVMFEFGLLVRQLFEVVHCNNQLGSDQRPLEWKLQGLVWVFTTKCCSDSSKTTDRHPNLPVRIIYQHSVVDFRLKPYVKRLWAIFLDKCLATELIPQTGVLKDGLNSSARRRGCLML